MTVVAVLGAGAGGAAAAVDLDLRGFGVRLWNRNPTTLEPLVDGIEFDGLLGSGTTRVQVVTPRLEEALVGADVALLCLPALAHADVIRLLSDVDDPPPLVLNPGHLGGALEARAGFLRSGRPLPPIAEFSTLTYVARKPAPNHVSVTGVADRVRVAGLPGGDPAVDLAREMYPRSVVERDVLATGLSDVNMVLHPPGAILGAAWVEATGGSFTFYVEGMTPGVATVMRALDEERREVAASFDHRLPSLVEEMLAIGTVEAGADSLDLQAAIGGGEANSRIKAPDSLQHRYYREDLAFGLMPLVELATTVGVDVPVARALLTIGETLVGPYLQENGRTMERLGLEGLDRDGIIGVVRG